MTQLPTIDPNRVMLVLNKQDNRCPICEQPMETVEEFTELAGKWFWFKGDRCPDQHILIGCFETTDDVEQ